MIALHADIVLSYEKHLSCGMSSLNIMVSFYYWERPRDNITTRSWRILAAESKNAKRKKIM